MLHLPNNIYILVALPYRIIHFWLESAFIFKVLSETDPEIRIQVQIVILEVIPGKR